MKVLVLVLFVATTSAVQNQYSNNYVADSGQYVPDNSGQYVPDDSGRYLPDDSGAYIPDGLGGYIHQASALYKGDDGRGQYTNKKNENFYPDRYQPYQGGNAIGIKPTGNFLNSASNLNKDLFKPNSRFDDNTSSSGKGTNNNNFGNFEAASSQVTIPVSKGPVYGLNSLISNTRYDAGRYADGRWKIIRQSGDVDTDGYHWDYETENGIAAEESGKLANKGTDKEAMRAKGFYQYTGPDNVLYYVGYTADENGFLPQGNHIPTPPPIPAEIARSLEYLKAHGKL